MKMVTYGLGGYDESKPNNNIVEIIDEPDEVIEDAAEEEEIQPEVQ